MNASTQGAVALCFTCNCPCKVSHDGSRRECSCCGDTWVYAVNTASRGRNRARYWHREAKA